MALFSQSDREDLAKNKNVIKVTDSNVTYTPTFKIKAIKKLLNGSTAKEIFEEAGINLALFSKDYPKKSLQKWRKILEKHGEKGFKEERRGSGATGRPKGKKFKNLEEENAYLRAKLDFLKKLRALEEKSLKKKSSF